MNKVALANIIAEKCAVSKKQAEEMIECFTETVTNTLKAAGEVTIAGFGTFSAKKRAGRVGVNPQRPTEKIQIPPVTVPKFKSGKTLKDALKK
ncbi:MAG: HU family DNA-binding protein [Patescibacteria group bacterium]